MTADRWRVPLDVYRDDLGYRFLQYIPTQNVYHPGIDLGEPGDTDLGKPVLAAAVGIVDFVGNDPKGWGNHVFIKHKMPEGNTIYSHYAHLQTIICTKGQSVEIGTMIGRLGKTGNAKGAHLHFEIRKPTGLGYTFYPIGWTVERIKQYYFDPLSFIASRVDDQPADTTTTALVSLQSGANIRLTPQTTGQLIEKLPVGTRLSLDRAVEGSPVLDSSIWYRLAGREAYVWGGAVTIVDTPVPSPPPPNQVTDDKFDTNALAVLHAFLPQTKFGNVESLTRELVASYQRSQGGMLSTLSRLFGIT